MTDLYLVLTPVLTLIVIGLARFVGCNPVFGLVETTHLLDPPTDVLATPGDQRVDLTWIYPPGDAISFTIIFGTQAGGPYPGSQPVVPGPSAQHAGSVPGLPNGVPHFFKITGETGDSDIFIKDSAEVSATPGVTSFVVSYQLGIPTRNNFQGFVGMAFTMGPADLIVTQLGRIVGPGNAGTHVVKLVEAIPSGQDVDSVTVSTVGAPVGQFAYASLPAPVTLRAFRQYYLVSHEEAGGDYWHDVTVTTVTTTGVAAVTSGVYNEDAAPGFKFEGGAGQTYGPVDFRY